MHGERGRRLVADLAAVEVEEDAQVLLRRRQDDGRIFAVHEPGRELEPGLDLVLTPLGVLTEVAQPGECCADHPCGDAESCDRDDVVALADAERVVRAA